MFDHPLPSVLIRTAFSVDHILSALTGLSWYRNSATPVIYP